jgi:hypothetical protein
MAWFGVAPFSNAAPSGIAYLNEGHTDISIVYSEAGTNQLMILAHRESPGVSYAPT